jgi:hypothetical protein
MFWIVLLLVAGIGIFINSFQLFFLALIGVLLVAWPLLTLPSLGAVIIWAIKQNLRK